MGNSNPTQFPVTKNWRYVSPDLIRNELTHELIQKSTIYFEDPDQQLYCQQLLTKRIQLMHPNVLKLIYFANNYSSCYCSPDGKPYSTNVYTEFSGDSLKQYSKIHRVSCKSYCPCIGIIQGAIYLQRFYGFFIVNTDAVFLNMEGSIKQTWVKLWINPVKSQSQPNKICSEKEMIDSLWTVYSFVYQKGYCSKIKQNQLKMLKNSSTIEQLKHDITHFHQQQEQIPIKHKRTHSDYEVERKVQHRRKQTPIEQIGELKSGIFGVPSVRAHSSQHYRIQPRKYQENKVQIKKDEQKDTFERKMKYNGNSKADQTFQSTQNTLNLQQNSNNNFKTLNQSKQNIKFNYSNHYGSNKNKKVHVFKEKDLQTVQENTNYIKHHFDNRSIGRIIQPVTARNQYHPNILFSSQFGASTISQKGLPINQENQLRYHKNQEESFIKREMEIPLKEQETKDNNVYRLPTTSRSPPKGKDIQNMAPINQVKEPKLFPFTTMNRNKRIASFSGSSSNGPKQKQQLFKVKENDKFKRLEKYTEQIKQYEQNIRNWISNSMGTKKRRQIPVRPALQSDRIQRPKQFKEVKSVYNEDSDPKNNEASSKQDYRIKTEEFDELNPPPIIVNKRNYTHHQFERDYNLTEEQEEVNQFEEKLRRQYQQMQQRQRSRQFEDYRYREPEYQHYYYPQHRQEGMIRGTQLKREYNQLQPKQRLRFEQNNEQKNNEWQYQLQRQRQLQQLEYKRQLQRYKQEQQQQQRKSLQRQQLQQDLEKQRRMINSQMNDLLSNEAKKQQYKNIREKVKQKKQIFAQLKAEATKILDDSQY